MARKQVGGGGRLERFLMLNAGVAMACLGAFGAKYSYVWATSPLPMENRWTCVATAAFLSFLMLRGALAVALKRE